MPQTAVADPETGLTLEQLAAMTEDERYAWYLAHPVQEVPEGVSPERMARGYAESAGWIVEREARQHAS